MSDVVHGFGGAKNINMVNAYYDCQSIFALLLEGISLGTKPLQRQLSTSLTFILIPYVGLRHNW